MTTFLATYQVECKGITPLIMHHDDVEWADFMDAWKSNPDNSGKSKPGDDRTPSWRWIGYCWTDEHFVGIPADALGSCLMKAGTRVLIPGGKRGKTFKELSQSGMAIADPLSPVLLGGNRRLAKTDIEAFQDIPAFSDHKKTAARLGFNLLVNRVTVGSSRHIRVRPLFTDWAFSFRLTVWEELLTEKSVADICQIAGNAIGIGDWRPTAPKKPGPYGRFSVDVSKA